MSLWSRLPHVVTVVTPATETDRYGNTVRDYGTTATRVNVRGWMQRRSTEDIPQPARDGQLADWVLYTKHPVDRLDRVEWQGFSFMVDGIPYPVWTPGGLSHYQVPLRQVEG
jgi:hypothetical protein